MPNSGIQGISLTVRSCQELKNQCLCLFFFMSCSFPNCKANYYFLEGALDALLCGNSSDAG